MTHLSNGTIVTDIDAHDDNNALTAQGYSIRYVETIRLSEEDVNSIFWDAPEITEADLPF